MSKHVISVCIFCLICATHSPCASHVAVGNEYLHKQHYELLKDPNRQPLSQVNVRDKSKDENELSDNVLKTDAGHQLVKRNVNQTVVHDEDHLKKIFALYGDGENIKMEGFERLMKNLLAIVSIKSINKSEETEGTSYSNNSKRMVRLSSKNSLLRLLLIKKKY